MEGSIVHLGRTKHHWLHLTLVAFCNNIKEWSSHLKLGHELCEDAEEDLGAGRLALLPEVGGHLGELLHGAVLQRVQGLHRGMAVLQEALGDRGQGSNGWVPRLFGCYAL